MQLLDAQDKEEESSVFPLSRSHIQRCIDNRDCSGEREREHEEARQRETSRHLSDARRTRKQRRGRQVSSLKLKDAQNWNSPAKVGRCASRGCFEDEVDCLEPLYLPRPALLSSLRAIPPSWNE